jgi:hypothetical protein
MNSSPGYLNEAEINQREKRLETEQKEKALALISAASEAISALNKYVEQLPEKVVINNSLALRYYLGRAGQDTRKSLGTGVPQGHKLINAPLTAAAAREELRKVMRQRGFNEDEILRRFPILPYERAAKEKEQELTEFEQFAQAFYKTEARRMKVPVEKVANNLKFQLLARQTHDTLIELGDF